MKKIIVISYFFPPCSKAGAHRAYSMAQYLPKFGWQPIFIAPEKGYYGRLQRYDNALLETMDKFLVYRLPFYYPFNDGSSNLLARAVRYLWELILIPDGKAIWNKELKKKVKQIIKLHKPDVLFITATPFSSFLLAPYLKKHFNLPIILDYRDPWAENPGIENMRFKSKFSLHFEKKCIKASDLITTASYYIIDYIKKTVGTATNEKRFFGFPYGYNGNFFRKHILPIKAEKDAEKITMTFAGSVHGDINPEVILEGINIVVNNNNEILKKLKINCYGTLFGYSNQPQSLIDRYGLKDHITLHPFLTYEDFLKVLRKSSLLLLPHGESPIARVLYPTKLFDYLGVKRPILYIGTDGQVSKSIKNISAGVCVKCEPNNIAKGMTNIFNKLDFSSWYSNNSEYEKLDRSNIFSGFCKELDRLLDN